MTSTCYKVLGTDGQPHHGGTGTWSLPTLNDDGSYTPGDWMPEITDVEPCVSGYHYCAGEGELIHWLGQTIYIVEPGPVVVPHENKHVTNTSRLIRPVDTWNDRTARLLAADCAERVLHLFEEKCPDDKRPRAAIDAARAFANGHITTAELSAAWDAAWAAALAAAWDVAWEAARAAALAAASGAARAAALDAARAAAWAAALAAASDAARAAALDAARAAAWAAERQWQAERLAYYLNGEGESD